MGDDRARPPWPSRLTPISSRALLRQGARDIAVHDFIDRHLDERPAEAAAYQQSQVEPQARRCVDPGFAPAAPTPAPGWAPAGPPMLGKTARPQQAVARTILMQAVAPR